MQKKSFSKRLNYTLGNEDWRTEKKALQIKPTDDVLCITASGDRPLNLLMEDCRHLTSIDMNPCQNELLHLKCAALQSLDYSEYLDFLGATPSNKRPIFYAKVRQNLSPSSLLFWNKRERQLHKGILYQGRVEKATKTISFVANLLMPKKIKKTFGVKTLEEQKKCTKRWWNTFLFRKTMDVLLSRRVMRLAAVDPGLFMYLPQNMRLGSYIFNRLLNSFDHCLAKNNIIFSLVFRGYVERSGLPLYLQPEGFYCIKERLSRLSIETGDLIQHLEKAPANSYDCFSMSDIASYIDQNAFEKMIENMYHAAKPGARFCIRQFSSDHQIPKAYEHLFNRDTALEQQLEQEDSCFVYRFMVGTITK